MLTPAHAYHREEGPKLAEDYERCERIARKKEYEAAAACVAALAPKRTRTRAELAYRQAEWLEASGQFAAARDAFLAVGSTFPREPMGARGRFRAARILEDHMGRPDDALAEYKQLVREAPDALGAVNALVHIEELLAPDALYEFYERELVARPNSEMATTILARIGRRALNEPGQAARAVKVYDALAKRPSAKRDDALYYGARAHLLAGDVKGAQERLSALLDTRERSPLPGKLVPGNLNSSHMDDARFLLAEIARDRLHDAKLARVHLQTLIDDYPDSRLVDDALHALAQLAPTPADAQKYRDQLVRLRPDSRYARKSSL